MRVLNDFKCVECGHTSERLLDNDILEVDCQYCQGIAKKARAVPNFQLEGTSGDYPTAADKWVKSREQKMAQERKADNS